MASDISNRFADLMKEIKQNLSVRGVFIPSEIQDIIIMNRQRITRWERTNDYLIVGIDNNDVYLPVVEME